MATDAILDRLCAEFDSEKDHIRSAVALLERGAPPAFAARYRRHEVGGMLEERLVAIADRLHLLNELEQRKDAILEQAKERGKDVEALRARLGECFDQDLVDDYYQSMRPRRRTTAVQMEEKGLLPLAIAIQHRQLGEQGLAEAAQSYIHEQNGLPSVEAVLEGVALILAEKIVNDPETRAKCRDELRRGVLRAKATNPGKGGAERYQQFFDFAEPISRISAGRMLALRRAEREKILELELGLPDNQHRDVLRSIYAADLPEGAPLREFYDVVFDHAWNSGLRDGCGRDVRRRIKEKADRESVRTYARNLRSQLLAPPLGHKKVLALRNSSKTVWLALIAEDGSVAQHKTLHSETDEQRQQMIADLCALIRAEKPAAIALPHGKRQASAEKLVEALRQALAQDELPMLIPVDEAASAIFATSATGRRAMPGVEVGVRTAISLGRRLQDPMRELLGMEFRTLGLGQTLDDVHQGMLQRELDAVVTSCVASVGVDLNTADQDLLSHVPGVGQERAKAILDHKKKIGGYSSRAQLLEVTGIDADSASWFSPYLLIEGGSEPLDRTPVQTADYALARAIATARGVAVEELFGKDLRDIDLDAFTGPDADKNRVLLVVQALRHSCRDARGELTATTNQGVHTMADLRADMELRGRVANLTEFGAFVDLGIGQDGLIHISQIPGHRLRDPHQMLRVGEVVQVWVAHLDQEKGKISLTMQPPRHVQEGRQPTLGERMDQRQGRRERRPRREEPATPLLSRAARAPESRKGRNRAAPLTPEGKPDKDRFPTEEVATPTDGQAPAQGAQGGQGGGERQGGGRGRFGGGGGGGGGDRRYGGGREDRGGRGRDRDDRPSRGRPNDPRVFTIESGREASEQKGHRGELTSLAGLRNLLQKSEPKRDDADKS